MGGRKGNEIRVTLGYYDSSLWQKRGKSNTINEKSVSCIIQNEKEGK